MTDPHTYQTNIRLKNVERNALHKLGLGNIANGVRWLLDNIPKEMLEKRISEHKNMMDNKVKDLLK